MQKKVVINIAQKLSQLRTIPYQKLPSTLKTQIKLPNISHVRLHYRPMCKNVGPSLKFMRQYGPPLRFYNPDLIIEKKPDINGPLAMVMQIYKKNKAQPITIVPDQFKKVQDLLDRIKNIDSE